MKDKGQINMTLTRLTTISVNGKQQHVKVKVKRNEAKSYIMKINKWTTEEYNKKYDILRNKLRAYEAFLGNQGIPVKKQSVADILYKEAKAKAHYGKDYEPSIEMQRIKSFSSISSGKKGKKQLQSKSYIEKKLQEYSEVTSARFEALTDKNTKAKEIFENIKNPIMRERALSDYANQLHVEMDRTGKAQEHQAIPIGEAIGSDHDIEFDYSAYQQWDD